MYIDQSISPSMYLHVNCTVLKKRANKQCSLGLFHWTGKKVIYQKLVTSNHLCSLSSLPHKKNTHTTRCHMPYPSPQAPAIPVSSGPSSGCWLVTSCSSSIICRRIISKSLLFTWRSRDVGPLGRWAVAMTGTMKPLIKNGWVNRCESFTVKHH